MMRSILALIVLICFLFSGCGFFGERIREPVTFYYLCRNYQKDLCCVITSEEREASGHSGDLSYLLALYLMGPSEDEHRSPLPTGSKISTSSDNGHILVELTNINPMSDSEFSLVCACITLTCYEITDTESVTVKLGEKEKTMTERSLTLFDIATSPTQSEESQ